MRIPALALACFITLAPPPPAIAQQPAALPALHAPRGVQFDRPQAGGAFWVMGADYKASFAADGWSFVPRPRAGALELEPLHFHFTAATVGDTPLAVADAMPTRDGQRFTFAHGGVLQHVDVDDGGVEQSFVLTALPNRGELQLELTIATTMQAKATADGLAFTGAWSHVDYSRAIAIDARGERCTAATQLRDGRLTIVVPAAFVAAATLPLTIDPRVAAAVVASGTGGDLADPDIACLEATLAGPAPVLAAVYGVFFGANDWDCYVQLLDQNMVLQGAPIPIDVTTEGWQVPRIAAVRVLWDVFLVVAQVRNGANPKKVSARGVQFTFGWGTRPVFDIANTGVDSLAPDVGGDPTGPVGRPAFFTVVWEHARTATDHDVLARQVDGNLTLQGTAPIPIAVDTNNQTRPTISKSCGQLQGNLSSSDQRWAIVFQQTVTALNEDIFGSFVSWNGSVVPVGGNNTFPVDTVFVGDQRPQVSSPTLHDGSGRRLFLAVYERAAINAGDIAATCFDQSGNVLARGDINILENDPTRTSWPQSRPAVDSDGVRFAVAYHELYQNNTTANDLDTRMSLVALANGNSLVVEEPGAILGFSGNREFNSQVTAFAAGGAAGSVRYFAVNDRDNTDGSFAIDARSYDGVPLPSLAVRPTACGTLSLAATGPTTLGGTVTFTLSPGLNLSGFLAGGATSSPVGPCAGCTIGVSGSIVLGSSLLLHVPTEPALIGATLSLQGFEFDAVGPCLGQLHLSDTIDLTVQ